MNKKSYLQLPMKSRCKTFFTDHNHHGHHHPYHGLTGGAPLIYFHHGSFSPSAMAGMIVVSVLSMLSVAVVCCALVRYRHKFSR